jgi:hypothetical protein
MHTPSIETFFLHAKISVELLSRYGIEDRLASEMAWDLIEVLTAVDSNLDKLDKYILN